MDDVARTYRLLMTMLRIITVLLGGPQPVVMLCDVQQVTTLIIPYSGQDAQFGHLGLVPHSEPEDPHCKRDILLIVVKG